MTIPSLLSFFFFNDTATTEIYTLSLHDALPISTVWRPTRRTPGSVRCSTPRPARGGRRSDGSRDRKSTRLNSSHSQISYAVFCLKKKKKNRRAPSPSHSRQRHTATTQPYLPVSS